MSWQALGYFIFDVLRNSKNLQNCTAREGKKRVVETENRKLINPASVANLNRAWKKCCTRKKKKVSKNQITRICLMVVAQEGNVKFLSKRSSPLPRCDVIVEIHPRQHEKSKKKRKEREGRRTDSCCCRRRLKNGIFFTFFWRKNTFFSLVFFLLFVASCVCTDARKRRRKRGFFFFNKIVCLHNNNNS